jgi:hypothetical protein
MKKVFNYHYASKMLINGIDCVVLTEKEADLESVFYSIHPGCAFSLEKVYPCLLEGDIDRKQLEYHQFEKDDTTQEQVVTRGQTNIARDLGNLPLIPFRSTRL